MGEIWEFNTNIKKEAFILCLLMVQQEPELCEKGGEEIIAAMNSDSNCLSCTEKGQLRM